MEIFRASKTWPAEERYSLTDQIRRSSRSVCANLAEAWGKRRYVAHFTSKLTDADGENLEAQTWLILRTVVDISTKLLSRNSFKPARKLEGFSEVCWRSLNLFASKADFRHLAAASTYLRCAPVFIRYLISAI